MATAVDCSLLVLGGPSEGPDQQTEAESLAAIDGEIADLEARLALAKQKRQRQLQPQPQPAKTLTNHESSSFTTTQHFLLLLADSALPLGSFAFSSGLESFIAHGKQQQKQQPAFSSFLPLSIASYGAASLPFVLAAHDAAAAHLAGDLGDRAPPASLASALALLDDTYDATVICTVGRRASVAQGRALLSLWERSFVPALVPAGPDPLRPFSQLVKQSGASSELPLASAHLPPLFGAVAGLASLTRRQAAHVFVLAHTKALVSAAVRASMMGPYQAQRLLASDGVRRLVSEAVDRSWAVPVEAAGQTVPAMDLWMGRHEMLYSRIFNS